MRRLATLPLLLMLSFAHPPNEAGAVFTAVSQERVLLAEAAGGANSDSDSSNDTAVGLFDDFVNAAAGDGLGSPPRIVNSSGRASQSSVIKASETSMVVEGKGSAFASVIQVPINFFGGDAAGGSRLASTFEVASGPQPFTLRGELVSSDSGAAAEGAVVATLTGPLGGVIYRVEAGDGASEVVDGAGHLNAGVHTLSVGAAANVDTSGFGSASFDLRLVVGTVAKVIETVAGNGDEGFSGDGGPGDLAAITGPTGLALDGAGNLYIADFNSQRIRKLNAATGVISTVAGTGLPGFRGDGGAANLADLAVPMGVAIDSEDNLCIADTLNNRIRCVDSATGVISTVAGGTIPGFAGDGGPATAARLFFPVGLAFDPSDNLYIADTWNHRIRRIDRLTGVITTVAGDGTPGFAGDGGPAVDGSLLGPTDVEVNPETGDLWIADWLNHRVRKVDSMGVLSTIAGDGIADFAGDGGAATAARLSQPFGVSVDANGNGLVADQGNSRIRRIDGSTGLISTVAGIGTTGFSGDGGDPTAAELAFPVAVVGQGDCDFFIGDMGNRRARKVSLDTGE